MLLTWATAASLSARPNRKMRALSILTGTVRPRHSTSLMVAACLVLAWVINVWGEINLLCSTWRHLYLYWHVSSFGSDGFTSSFSAIMPPPPPVSLICIKSLIAFWSPGREKLLFHVSLNLVPFFLSRSTVIFEGISMTLPFPHVRVTHQYCTRSSECWARSRPHVGDKEQPSPQ